MVDRHIGNVGWCDDVYVAIVDGLFSSDRGADLFLVLVGQKLLVLCASAVQRFLGIKGEVCPEVKLSSEIRVCLSEKEIMGVRRVLGRTDDVEAVQI